MPVFSSGASPAVQLVAATATLTRPADTTAYESGDLVAISTTAGSVTPLQFDVSARGQGVIRRARITKSGTGVANCTLRLHLYTAAPTVANGDNAAWSSTQRATYLGAFDVAVDKAMSDGAAGHGAPLVGAEIAYGPSVSTLYGLLEARGAYTPASAETFLVTLENLS